MHDAVALEGAGVPTAVVITSAFVREAEVQCAALGAVGIEPVIIDHPLSTLPAEQIAARADAAVAQIVRILTR